MMQVELLAALLVWGGAGWLADRWLGSGPWLTVLGALVGYAAGFYLMWLRSMRMDAEEAADDAALLAARATEAPTRMTVRGARTTPRGTDAAPRSAARVAAAPARGGLRDA